MPRSARDGEMRSSRECLQRSQFVDSAVGLEPPHKPSWSGCAIHNYCFRIPPGSNRQVTRWTALSGLLDWRPLAGDSFLPSRGHAELREGQASLPLQLLPSLREFRITPPLLTPVM